MGAVMRTVLTPTDLRHAVLSIIYTMIAVLNASVAIINVWLIRSPAVLVGALALSMVCIVCLSVLIWANVTSIGLRSHATALNN